MSQSLPPRPVRPEQPTPTRSPRGGGCVTVLAAVVIAGGLLALVVFLSAGLLALALLVPLGVFLLVAFHYLVWGKWLSRLMEEEHAAQKKSAADEQRS